MADGQPGEVSSAGGWSVVTLLPGLLLILVALGQIGMAKGGHDLTPAKGGGYGLFSTIDKLNNRSFVVYALGETWQTPIKVAGSAERQRTSREMLALPSEGHMRRFLVSVLADAESSKAAFDANPANAAATGYGEPLVSVRVVVFKRAYDAAAVQSRQVQVAECILDRGATTCR